MNSKDHEDCTAEAICRCYADQQRTKAPKAVKEELEQLLFEFKAFQTIKSNEIPAGKWQLDIAYSK
jgi:hypothetical protein